MNESVFLINTDTITSRPDCHQNADNVCPITFSVILSYIVSIKIKLVLHAGNQKWVSNIHFRKMSTAYVSFYSCNWPGCGFSVLFRYAHDGVDSSLYVLCYFPIPWPRVMVSWCSNTRQQYLNDNKSLSLLQPMNLRRMSNTSIFWEPQFSSTMIIYFRLYTVHIVLDLKFWCSICTNTVWQNCSPSWQYKRHIL